MSIIKLRSETAAAGLRVGQFGAPVKAVKSGTVAVDPPSINASTRGTATATITGVAAGDLLILEPPSALESGLLYVGHYVSAANTVTIMLYNPTGAAVDGANRTWRYLWIDLT
jgi:hypothetical protein